MKNNQKWVAIYLAVMLYTPTISFAACDVIPALQDGFYLGVSGGYDVFSIKNKLQFSTLNTTFLSMDPKVNINGVFGGTFIGYGKYYEPYRAYLGAEFFINGSSASDDYDATFDSDVLTTQISVIANYGLSLMPGMHLNPQTMLYLRLGYNWIKVDVDETYFQDSFPSEYHQFGTLHGFNYGIGLETLFYHHINLRLEYNHTQYNSLESHMHASVTPADNQFNAGLIYHF